jgi:CheY-like chemotaxis protein
MAKTGTYRSSGRDRQEGLFMFDMPQCEVRVSDSTSGDDPQRKGRRPHVPDRAANGSAREVLVVDDNEDLREMLIIWLQAHGFRVTSAGNGADALAFLACGYRPALILLDMMMPEMDGMQVLERLQQDRTLAAIPVVVMSASHRQRPAHAAHFIQKPIDTEAMIALVRTYCSENA